MGGGGFRGSLFGGFNRNDVAAFISSLSMELNASKTECEGLKNERKALKAEIENLTAQIAQLKGERDARQQHSSENEALKARVEELLSQLAAMQARIDKDAKTMEEFDRIRNRLSVMEYEACRRAEEIETEASKRAREVEIEASKRAQYIEFVAVDKYERIIEKLTSIIDSLRLEYDEIRTGTLAEEIKRPLEPFAPFVSEAVSEPSDTEIRVETPDAEPIAKEVIAFKTAETKSAEPEALQEGEAKPEYAPKSPTDSSFCELEKLVKG